MSEPSQSTAHEPSESATRPDGLRGFWCLLATQFQGAFSDNVNKFLVLYLIIGTGMSTEQRDSLVPVVNGLFALPFILFSMAGGYLADRYSKRSVAIWVKVAEIAIMALAALAFGANSIPLMLTVVFLMSAQSAL